MYNYEGLGSILLIVVALVIVGLIFAMGRYKARQQGGTGSGT